MRLAQYRLRVAMDRPVRERAWRLAHRAYCRCGHFTPEQNDGLYKLPHDDDPQTLTLLVEDRTGTDAATVTLAFDAPRGLPCEAIFKPELDLLRSNGRRLVEVARLALDVAQPPPKMMLVRLFNIIYIYAKQVMRHTDFVVEVVPHHAGFYKKFLKFEQFGPNRKWPRGQNVTATLLRLDLEAVSREIERSRLAATPTLYNRALSPAAEKAVAEYLTKLSQTVLPVA
jgi:hypothetical protein